VAVVLALAAALGYGVSDFLAGMATRRAGALAVVVTAELAGLVLLAASLLLVGGAPDTAALAWGAGAGLGTTVGTLALYQGLAAGRMNVVAPLSGVGAAALPAVVGVAFGERLGAVAVGGVLVALVAIVLVCASARSETAAGEAPARLGVPEGVLAGVGFAVLFVGLRRAGSDAGLWPVVSSQVSSLGVLAGYGLATGRRLRPERPQLLGAAAAGLVGTAATVLYALAAGRGMLAVVAVVTSLYPAGTVLLAAAVLRERATPAQVAGLLGSAAAVTLIALG
jgi:uncharacterized membrane protein